MLGQQLAVGAAAERGVEVDQVDPLGALRPARPARPATGRRTSSRCRPRPAPAGRPGRRRRRRRAAARGGCVGHGRSCPLRLRMVGQVGAARAGWPCGRVTAIATQLRSSCAPASPDFSGWNWVADSGPFSTAATKRRAVVGPGDLGRDGGEGAVGLEVPALHGVGVDEVEPLALDAREQPGALGRRRPCSSPCAGTTGAGSRSTVPGHSREPRLGSLDAGLGRRRRTAPACPRRCRAPAGRRRAAASDQPGPRDRAQPAHAGAEVADARHEQPVAPPAPRPRSAVSSTSAPTRSRARTAERTLPLP